MARAGREIAEIELLRTDARGLAERGPRLPGKPAVDRGGGAATIADRSGDRAAVAERVTAGEDTGQALDDTIVVGRNESVRRQHRIESDGIDDLPDRRNDQVGSDDVFGALE